MIKRQNPLISPLGMLLTFLLMGALGFSLWKDRGMVFSPGAVTGVQREGLTLQGFDAHADFEKECRYCHQPLRASLGEMCLACHTAIDRQISDETGVHAQLENVTRCQNCHSDHQGRDFNPTLSALQDFDHELARFSLRHHQVDYAGVELECATCHAPGVYASVADGKCLECHALHDAAYMHAHQVNFGEDCQTCHDGVDRMSGFDHAQVFPLDGRHGEIDCLDCHTDRVFAGTPAQCEACHPEPEVHAGVFGVDCAACHITTAWSPARLLEHSFPLDHGLEDASAATACAVCHPVSYLEYTCYGCHEHQEGDIARKHSEEGITSTELAACVECHPGGREAEEEDDD